MKKLTPGRIILLVLPAIVAASLCHAAHPYVHEEWTYMKTIVPEGYVCYRTSGAVTVDGRLDDPAWKNAPWTNYFVDIEGSRKPAPRFRTRAKMLWDNYYFYFAADMEEPHVWGTLTFHDQVICRENDFEIFIDPDGDTHEYYELELGPLNTLWDLFLVTPYKDMAPGVGADQTWGVPGIKTAVHVDGTINYPGDTDRGWSVEFAIPWTVLAEFAHKPSPPRHGDQWRVNFSRVEYVHEIVTSTNTTPDISNNAYKTAEGIPCDNWVWSPQGIIAMHCPEKWGYVQFSTAPPGSDEFKPDPTLYARHELLDIYYLQRDYHEANERYAATLDELGYRYTAHESMTAPPAFEAAGEGYRASVNVSLPDGSTRKVTIHQDSKIVVE